MPSALLGGIVDINRMSFACLGCGFPTFTSLDKDVLGNLAVILCSLLCPVFRCGSWLGRVDIDSGFIKQLLDFETFLKQARQGPVLAVKDAIEDNPHLLKLVNEVPEVPTQNKKETLRVVHT